MTHDGKRITGTQADTVRYPWSTCPGSVKKLHNMVGMPLQRMHVGTDRDGRLQCTHLYDLARLAAARALVGKSVQYDVDVPDRVDGRTRVTVYRDGAPILIWDVNGKAVEGPAPFAGHGYLGSPVWPEGLDDDTLEAAAVLRRD